MKRYIVYWIIRLKYLVSCIYWVDYISRPPRKFQCIACGHIFELPHGLPRPINCPKCGAPAHMLHRVDRGRHRWGWRR